MPIQVRYVLSPGSCAGDQTRSGVVYQAHQVNTTITCGNLGCRLIVGGGDMKN